MKNMKLKAVVIRAYKCLRLASVFLMPVVLLACGGGGVTPVTDVTKTLGGIRALSPEFTLRKAVNYSPYRTATTVGDASKSTDIANEVITDAMIIEDLTLLKKAGFGLIRLFNSDEKVALRTLRVISDPANNLDIKVYLGMWMAGYNEAENKAQVAYGVALANSYPSIVLAVSVGNETLVNWSDHAMPPALLATYIGMVRSQIAQPITTDDNWAFYASAPRIILDQIDFASVHTYAMVDTHYNPTFWDWMQLGETNLTLRAAKMMDAALAATKSDYNKARNYLDTKGLATMPIIIGETGWKAQDSSGANWYKYLAHPVNQKMFYDRLMAWANEGKTGAGPKSIFYFEAFDEQWKSSDDKWGLFNKNRQARYVIQDQHAADATFVYEAGNYTTANAVYFSQPVLHAAITANRYTLLSDGVTQGEFKPAVSGAGAVSWNAWDDPATAVGADDTANFAPNDVGHSILITPRPKSWGWGFFNGSTDGVTENLSNFSSGYLNFSIKTAYPGKLEIGLSTDTEFDSVQEAFVALEAGQYGYSCNTNSSWCDIKIPLQAFKTANAKLDLRWALTRFVIADRYAYTGKSSGANVTTPINIDTVYWSK